MYVLKCTCRVKLLAGVRKRFHSDIAFDDDVWQSMRKNSKLVNNSTAIEHNVLEEWVFGGTCVQCPFVFT